MSNKINDEIIEDLEARFPLEYTVIAKAGNEVIFGRTTDTVQAATDVMWAAQTAYKSFLNKKLEELPSYE